MILLFIYFFCYFHIDMFPLDYDIQTPDCDNDETFEIDIDPH